MRNSNNNMLKLLTRTAVQKLAKTAGRKFFSAVIVPLLPYIALVLVLFFLGGVLFSAIYAVFPAAGILTAEKEPTEKDREEKAKYENLAKEMNSAEHWLVQDTSTLQVGRDGETEPQERQVYYPGKGIRKLPGLSDPETGSQCMLTWGQIYSVCLYWELTHGEKEVPDSKKKEIAEKLKPYFYYRPSTVQREVYNEETQTWEVVDTYHVYRLVEVSSIGGHYQYFYRWKTKTYELPTGYKERITQEEVYAVKTVGDRWDRLKQVIKEVCEVETDKDIDTARIAIWEAGEAYYRQQEWLSWLQYSIDSGLLSSAGIPPELREIFMEAEQRFGIPWWFIAAVALRESSFNPQAISSKGALGLMQVMPFNFERYAPRLGFSYPADINNPRAQVLIGTAILAEYIGDPRSIDWEGNGWKTDQRVINGLLQYSNYDESEELKRQALSPPHGYVYDILNYAEQFKQQRKAVWPLPAQYKSISSPYGPRIHPIRGTLDFHEGIDIPAPTGTPVYSATDGVVTFAGYAGDAGYMITVRDSFNVYCYLHLSKIDVRVGENVKAGQKIGEVGNTGASTGSHLDFRVQNIMTKQWINPLSLF